MRRVAFIGFVMMLGLSGCGKPGRYQVQGYIEGEFVNVSSPLGGTLQKLSVQRGTQVKAGDPLFALDNVVETTARDQAQAALTLSERDWQRQEKLAQMPGVSSEQELDKARSNHEQDQQRLVKAEWDLEQKIKSAPQAGLVFDTLYREGEWVPSGHPVVTLLPPQNIKVRAFVSEKQVGSIHAGDKARVLVDGVKDPFPGKVSYVSPKAEYTPPVIYSRESRDKLVFMIELSFDPEIARQLHPGQPVEVQGGFD